MVNLIATRLVAGIATLFAASVLIFATMEILPGDAATAVLGQEAGNPVVLEAFRKEYGLDRPAPVRYGEWVAGAVRFDFGRSLTNGLAVTELIRHRLQNTSVLLSITLLLMFPAAVAIGATSAIRRGSLLDAGLQVFTLVTASLPSFVTGIVFILLFSYVWSVLPAVSLTVSPATLALPVATLVLGWLPLTARMVRAGMIDVFESDYVQMARLKGLPERRVIRSHVLPNSLVPAVQAFALTAASMPAGIVIVEFLFSFEGVGLGLVQAVAARDVATVEAISLILVAVYVVANLLSDLATISLTPRLRVPVH